MKKYAYIGMCILLFAALAACHVSTSMTGGQNAAETPDSVTAPASAETSDSVTASDSAETSDSVTVPASAETSDSVTVPASAETPDSAASSAEARDLTAKELQQWSEFLCQPDCNGFLMSNFTTPLQADLGSVFYTGAGIGEAPTEEMIGEYLQENDLEEAYTDVTFIPYDKANEVLERRTGYTLAHFKLSGNDIPMYYSQKYAGYFQMAGDTNYMPVECVSGRRNADGSVFLEVRETPWEEDWSCTFETALRPDSAGQNTLFESNVITGGWMTWEAD